MKVEHTCSICNSDESTLLFYKWSYPIVKCRKCNFIETLISNEIDLSSIYTEEYYDGGRKDGYADYKASKVVLEKEFEDLLFYLEKFNPGHGVLVELGCAYGFLLGKAKTLYDHVVGFEISSSAIEFCRNSGLEVHPASEMEDLLPKVSPIDVLIMLDTIEHVENPRMLMESLFKNLATGGIIILTTGDIGSFYGRITGKLWRLMTPPQHLSFFSVNTMSRMLKDAGFEILMVDKPWKKVPIKLMLYQILSRFGLKTPGLIEKFPNMGLPINLFDAMRVVARKPE
jgi:SAM-dependent methyltransferase